VNKVNESDEEVTIKENESSQDNSKWIGVSAYFIFFIPLVLKKDSTFCKFHANQGLNLLLLSIAFSIAGKVVPVVGMLVISPLGGILCLILGIMGIINAINGKEKELPLIGQFRLIE